MHWIEVKNVGGIWTTINLEHVTIIETTGGIAHVRYSDGTTGKFPMKEFFEEFNDELNIPFEENLEGYQERI